MEYLIMTLAALMALAVGIVVGNYLKKLKTKK